ncbi:MAG: diaminopimelate epimerase [Armatimonadetes bacterium]|nr:diaminopimelate epimerase [Armatimonadota bacterium]
MRFTKMHGLGNDYLYFDGFAEDLERYDLARLSQLLSDRHFGVGSDGIILILPSDRADFRMRMFNSDGSEGEMCGNGIRCFAKFVYDRGLTTKTELEVETGAGIIRPTMIVENGKVTWVRVDMGQPRLKRGQIPMGGDPEAPAQGVVIELPGKAYTAHCVSMGNPHCVIFVDEITDAQVLGDGPLLETHELFPRKTNVEFAQVLSSRELRMRVWERGAGETLACGTGACATAVAAHLAGHCGREVTVHLRGGDLKIEWRADDRVMMTGPATTVAECEVTEDFIAAALRQ